MPFYRRRGGYRGFRRGYSRFGGRRYGGRMYGRRRFGRYGGRGRNTRRYYVGGRVF